MAGTVNVATQDGEEDHGSIHVPRKVMEDAINGHSCLTTWGSETITLDFEGGLSIHLHIEEE